MLSIGAEEDSLVVEEEVSEVISEVISEEIVSEEDQLEETPVERITTGTGGINRVSTLIKTRK